VKPPPFAYHAPTELDEAVALLGALGDGAKVLAGGQSLVPLLNMRLVAPTALVDIGRVGGLDGIRVADGTVSFGARVTHERLRRDAAVAAAQPLIARALDHVAHAVIRNRGTSVGSIVHADPAAELPAVLALLGGSLEVVGPAGARSIPATDVVIGPLESDVRAGEVAVAAHVPVAPARSGSAFVELARRHGDYAIAGVGVTVTLDAERRVLAARAACIGVGTATDVLDLAPALAGGDAERLDVADVVEAVRAFVRPDADVHASADYRRHLAGVLAGRAVAAAVADALDRSGEGR
jgi:carbon-monoxide dehydrogenase medium subunit